MLYGNPLRRDLEMSKNQVNSQMADDSKVSKTEIRIALVLYGGISLAIYENGVTRTFFDLVKQKGVFHLLLKLLDARAVVDVISGASAGGINGLMLAAALESGADFGQTAEVWRDLADIAQLLRPVSDGDRAESLFKGETYYQEELIKAFKNLVIRSDDKKTGGLSHLSAGDREYVPGEIDVFIAGTDLIGHVKTYTDGLGKKLEDKSHRVVFHLEHRPERKRLGMPSGLPEGLFDSDLTVENLESKADHSALRKKLDEQAVILASIARITSTFPAAFPPFRLNQVPREHQQTVSDALSKASELPITQYVDGGVLDNKPFEPVLKAIFHRMPFGRVDRRLFYVEPDPEEFSKKSSVFTPLSVITAALTGLPSHQSIGEKLEDLRRHNERTKWLQELKNDSHLTITSFDFYDRIRKQSLAKSLLLGEDEVPWAGSVLPVGVQGLYDEFLGNLKYVEIDPYDVDFHIRRAFYFLYKFYERLEKLEPNKFPEQERKIGFQIIALGRIIKYLKLIRDFLLGLREKIFEPPFGENQQDVQKSASNILELFRRFLQIQNMPWAHGFDSLAEYEDFGEKKIEKLQTFAEQGPLRKKVLTEIRNRAMTSIDEFDPEKGEFKYRAFDRNETVLQQLERVTEQIVKIDSDQTIGQFRDADACFYPLEYAAGIHELDEIEFVRISPKDSTIGLSDQAPKDKVSGDDFFHFAAFFRKDWRSNDILWGRLDSIGTVISALLNFKEQTTGGYDPKEAFKRNVKSDAFDALFPFDGCPLAFQGRVSAAWTTLKASNFAGKDIDDFARVLIEAAQEAAVEEDLEGVYSDHFGQEISWDRIDAKSATEKNPDIPAIQTVLRSLGPAIPAAFKGSSSSTTVHTVGDQLALLAKSKVKAYGDAFRKLKFGAQLVFGPQSPVPTSIFAEYVTQAYLLLWGMLNRSFKSLRLNIMEDSKIRLFFRNPVAAMHTILVLMRADETLAALSLMGILTASAVLFFIGLQGDGNSYYFYSALLMIFLSILLRLHASFRRKMFSRIVFAATFFVMLAFLSIGLIVEVMPLWDKWVTISQPVFDLFKGPIRHPDFVAQLVRYTGTIATGLSVMWALAGIWRIVSQPGFRMMDLEFALTTDEVFAIVPQPPVEEQAPVAVQANTSPVKPGWFQKFKSWFQPRGTKTVQSAKKTSFLRKAITGIQALAALKKATAGLWLDLPSVALYWLLLMSLSMLLYERDSVWAFYASIFAAVAATAGAALDLLNNGKLLNLIKSKTIIGSMVDTVRRTARFRYEFIFFSIGILSLNFLPYDSWNILGYAFLMSSILVLVNFGSRRLINWGVALAVAATVTLVILFTVFHTRFP